MKIFGSLIGWAIVLSLLLLSLTFVDFLALADIHKDYVSRNVLELLSTDISNELPDWTSAKFEWAWIRISLIVKTVIVIVVLVALVKAAKKLDG